MLLTSAWFSVGYHHADEHFQLLEFASYKAGHLETPARVLPWEYAARIRPGLQVWIAWAVMSTFEGVGIYDPFAVATALRLLSALLSFFCFRLLYKAFSPALTSPAAHHAFLASAFFLWFVPYIGVRFSSETWSGACFFIALAWLMLRPSAQAAAARLGMGFLLGLSFDFRYQAILLIGGVGLWLLTRKDEWRSPGLYALIAGVVAGIGLGLLADHWLYGEWTLSAWEYIRVNVLEGKANEFGRSPWYMYFSWIVEKAILPIGLVIIVGMLGYGWRHRNTSLVWAAFLFVLAHMVLSHKELRFLFPLVYMLPAALAWLWSLDTVAWLRKRAVWMSLVAVNGVLLLYRITAPASEHIYTLEQAYHHIPGEDKILYSTPDDPYFIWDLPPTYYRVKAGYSICVMEKPEDISRELTGKSILYAETPFLQDGGRLKGVNCRLLHATYPDLIMRYGNFFNWVGRTHISCVYQVERTDRSK